MKNLVIYDSQYGNTETIARAIAESISAEVVLAARVKSADLANLGMLVVGSPTHGGRPSTEIQQFLDQIPSDQIRGVKFATFDTRFREEAVKFSLKMLMKVIGYAAPKMAKILENKGGKMVTSPEGFIVIDREGPLFQGEIERAKKWLVYIK